jgi:hypothetical protein
MKNLLLIFVLIAFNSFSQELGDKKTVKATFDTYEFWTDEMVLVYFIDSDGNSMQIEGCEWLIDYDMGDFALTGFSIEGETDSYTLFFELLELNSFEWIESTQEYYDTGDTYVGWALVRIEPNL